MPTSTRTLRAALRLGPAAERLATPRRPWALLLASWTAAAVVLLAGAALTALLDRPLAMLLRDPAAVIGEDVCAGAECVFAGAISNIGVAVWLLTAWVCLRARRRVAERPWRRMLLWGALLTAALGLDDLLMIHDRWLPVLVPAGEKLLFFAYAAAGAAFVVVSRRVLPGTHVEALLAALGLLVASILVDVVAGDAHLFEDGVKLLGVAAWATFFWGTAHGLTRAPSLVGHHAAR